MANLDKMTEESYKEKLIHFNETPYFQRDANYVADKALALKPTSLIDICCGIETFMNIIKARDPTIRVRGIDSRSYGLNGHATGNIQTDDFTGLSTFDAATIMHAYLQFDKPEQAVANIRKLIKPNGHLLIVDPHSRFVQLNADIANLGYWKASGGDTTNWKYYSPEEMRAAVESQGFTTETEEHFGDGIQIQRGDQKIHVQPRVYLQFKRTD